MLIGLRSISFETPRLHDLAGSANINAAVKNTATSVNLMVLNYKAHRGYILERPMKLFVVNEILLDTDEVMRPNYDGYSTTTPRAAQLVAGFETHFTMSTSSTPRPRLGMPLAAGHRFCEAGA